MLGQRRKRWPNIKPTFGQPFVFAEKCFATRLNDCQLEADEKYIWNDPALKGLNVKKIN